MASVRSYMLALLAPMLYRASYDRMTRRLIMADDSARSRGSRLHGGCGTPPPNPPVRVAIELEARSRLRTTEPPTVRVRSSLRLDRACGQPILLNAEDHDDD